MTQNVTKYESWSLAEIMDLDAAELRAMLRGDHARLRVWAAWGLGMRLANEASSDVRLALGKEPVAGVRRQLLVVLAGLGEVDVVAALARHDPDADVRKTAARYVAELAVAHPDAYAIVAQLLSDERAETRAATVDGLRGDLPDAIERRLAALRSDVSERVRGAMARRDAAAADAETLKGVAAGETDSVVRRRALCAALELCTAAEVLSPMTASQRTRALRDMQAMQIVRAFSEFESLEPDRAYLDVIRFHDHDSEARRWLLSLRTHGIRGYWDIVARAYTRAAVLDEQERIALEGFVLTLEQSLLGSEPLAAPAGALAPWGSWSPLEASRRSLLETLKQVLGAS